MQFLISSVSIDSRGMRSSALPQRASPPLIPRPLASYGQKQSTRKRPVFPRSSWRASNKSDAGKGKALGYSRAEHGHRRRCRSSSGGGPLKKTASSAPPRLMLDVRAEFLARPELFAARPELSSAREEGRPSQAHFSGPSRAFGSPGSARAGPKARCYFSSTKLEKAKWQVGWILAR
jgi:hypothetical protein